MGKSKVILISILFCSIFKCANAVDVPREKSWAEAISGLNSGNVTINLTDDITVDDFNSQSWDKKTLENWNSRTLTINGNGKTLTIKSGFVLSGNIVTDIYNVNLVTTDVELHQKTKTAFYSSSVTIANKLSLSGGEGVTLNIDSGSTLNCNAETDLGTKSTINVSGIFELGSFTSHAGSSQLNVLSGGKVRVMGDGEVKQGANFSVASNGQLRFDGNFILTDGSNMTLNGDMEVYGNMDIFYGSSTIDGTLKVANELRIYYDNNNEGQPNITGNGTIAADEFFCKDNNSVSGEDCVAQLGNYFEVANIQRGNVVMPIVLSAFTAISRQNYVNVCWTTESEQNNDYFTIYRSSDGENFEQIGTEAGAGNSTMTLNYSFVDYYPLDGVSYYLIQQTDYDGTSKYSKKVVVKRSLSVEPCMVKVFPNPYKNDDVLTIDLGASNNTNVQVQIVDAMGKVVSNVSCKTIGSPMRINPKLNAGVYMVKVSVDGQSSTQKLVVE